MFLGMDQITTTRDVDAPALVNVIRDLARMLVRMPSAEKLSLSTLGALSTLASRGPMRLTDLTATEQVTQPAMTQIVSRLERDGLVTRDSDPHDGRAVLVRTTDAGAALVAARQADRLTYLTGLFDLLSPTDRDAIASAVPALTRFVELGAVAS